MSRRRRFAAYFPPIDADARFYNAMPVSPPPPIANICTPAHHAISILPYHAMRRHFIAAARAQLTPPPPRPRSDADDM